MTAARSLLDLAVAGSVLCRRCGDLVPVREARQHREQHEVNDSAARALGILESFTERAIYRLDHVLYSPPWCGVPGGCQTRLEWRGEDGEPCLTCPDRVKGLRTTADYERALSDYRSGYRSCACLGDGGGLWDCYEASACEQALAEKRHLLRKARLASMAVAHEPDTVTVTRGDAEIVAAYVEQFDIPDREREVYGLYWERGLGYGACAASMGLTKRSVRTLIARLRQRAHNTGMLGVRE